MAVAKRVPQKIYVNKLKISSIIKHLSKFQLYKFYQLLQQPGSMDAEEDNGAMEGYSEVPFADLEPLEEDNSCLNIEALDSLITEAREAAMRGVLQHEPVTESLLAHMTEEEYAVLEDVASGQVTVSEEHTAVRTTADLIAQLPNQEDSEEDYIQPTNKRRRIEETSGSSQVEELEQTISAGTSNVGSSSMHALQAAQVYTSPPQGGSSQPVLDYSTSGSLQNAVEQFYRSAYEWFGLATPPTVLPTLQPDPLCVPEHTARLTGTDGETLYAIPRTVVSSMLRNEMNNGRDLRNLQFVETFAKCFLDQQKFRDLCVSCGTFYKTHQAYVIHLVTEHGKFQCLYRCGATFNRPANLRKHMKHLHASGSNLVRNENYRISCPFPGCNRDFLTRTGLYQHSRVTHGSEMAPCPICRVTMDNHAAMNAHLLTVHGLQPGEPLPFACDVDGCSFRCRTKIGLDRHKRAVHNICHQPQQ